MYACQQQDDWPFLLLTCRHRNLMRHVCCLMPTHFGTSIQRKRWKILLAVDLLRLVHIRFHAWSSFYRQALQLTESIAKALLADSAMQAYTGLAWTRLFYFQALTSTGEGLTRRRLLEKACFSHWHFETFYCGCNFSAGVFLKRSKAATKCRCTPKPQMGTLSLKPARWVRYEDTRYWLLRLLASWKLHAARFFGLKHLARIECNLPDIIYRDNSTLAFQFCLDIWSAELNGIAAETCKDPPE